MRRIESPLQLRSPLSGRPLRSATGESSGFLLLEDGAHLLFEDGINRLLLEEND